MTNIRQLGRSPVLNPPAGNGGPPPEPLFEDRTKRQVATDTAADVIYGAMTGAIQSFDGNLAVSAEALRKALDKLLLDVADSESENAVARGADPERARHAGAVAKDKYAKLFAAASRKHMLT